MKKLPTEKPRYFKDLQVGSLFYFNSLVWWKIKHSKNEPPSQIDISSCYNTVHIEDEHLTRGLKVYIGPYREVYPIKSTEDLKCFFK